MSLHDEVVRALRTVRDPEMAVSVYDMGLIYRLEIDAGSVASIDMTLTAPNCPVAETLPRAVETAVRAVDGIRDVKLALTFDPPWTRERMSPAAKLFLGMEEAPSPLVSIRL